MTDFFKSVDSWFLVLCVVLLGGYFLWSIQNLFADLKASIKELKDTIEELFKDRNNHEGRITVLETRMSVCESCNGHGHAHMRESDK